MESETTRYLCAGVHLDDVFRHTVLEQMRWEKHRAVALPHGVNVELLVHHAILAKSRVTIRTVLLSLVFGAAVLYCAFNPLLAAIVSSLPPETTRDEALAAMVPMIPVLLPFWVVAVLIIFTGYILRNRVLRTLRKGCPVVIDTSHLAQISPVIRDRDLRNVVVYSGFSPFVGSGIDLGGWSFVIRRDKAKEELGIPAEPIPFTNSELYRHIRLSLDALALEGSLIQDKLYVNGQDIREDHRFLPDPIGPPVATVASETVENLKNNPSQTVRYYMAIHLIQWKGELVLSCFVRISQSGRHLFVEASYFLLPPVKENYYVVDSLSPRPSGKELFGLAVTSALAAPFLCLAAPFLLWGKIMEPYHRWHKRKQTEELIKENYSFDYGATTSIRALATSSYYRRYFQKLDKEMGLKLVERAILDSIIEFLDEKNVDTSDLKERTSMIFNNGVIVSGGYIRADTFTGGQGVTSEVVKQFSGTAHNTVPTAQMEVKNKR